MTFIRLLVSLAALVVFPAVAQARTTIIEPPGSHFPYQQWVDEAKVPTPEVTLTVIEDASGCEGEGSACTAEGAATIWADPLWSKRWDFLHEIGHNQDYVMPDWARTRFLSLTRDPRPWRSPPNSPHERFAEAWAACAIWGYRIARRPELGYLWEPSPRLHRRICRLIRTTG